MSWRRFSAWVTAWCLLLSALACRPDFDLRSSLVDTERVLAVVAEPAEARPGEVVSYSVVVAGPDGPVPDAKLALSYCTTPKPSSELTSVASACTEEAGLPLEPAGSNLARGPIPPDACRVHGPDPPPGDARPRDPDATGGFYQPVWLEAFGDDYVHLQRIRCNPSDLALDVARELSSRYEPNQNPQPLQLEVRRGRQLLESNEHGEIEFVPGELLSLRVSWDSSTRERYAVVDRSAQRVTEQTEGLRVDWFATHEGLALDRHTLEDENTAETFVSNELHVPRGAPSLHLWAVVHDSRRGAQVIDQQLVARD